MSRSGRGPPLRRTCGGRPTRVGQAALRALGAAAAGAAQVVLARGFRDRGEERVGVRDGEHGGDVAEAERGDQRRLERLGELDRAVAEREVRVLALERVDALEVAVAGDVPVSSIRSTPSSCHAAAPPLAWPVTVFCETTSSGLPGVRPSASLEALVQVGLGRVVHLGRRVVLGDDADVVGGQAEAVERVP